MWPRLVRFIAGFALGLLLWHYGGELYNRFLAVAATPLVRMDPRLRNAELAERTDMIGISSANGVFPPAAVQASQLTYNIILLLALFASNKRPFRDRNLLSAVVAMVILALSHIAS